MKFIRKQEEPANFTTWKQQASADWQPNWDNFQKPEKVEVHEALLTEQGHICCYCGQRIARAESHIEHFRPRTSFPELTLNYNNLLASCPGYTEEVPNVPNRSQEFCGQAKGAWHDEILTISPLQPDCATYFRYTSKGKILPAQDPVKAPAAAMTIDKLALNHRQLTRGRERAIDGIFQIVETLTEAEIAQFIAGLQDVDRDGKHVPFCSAVIYVLQQFQM
jgi:uncharacterized protein (TIGR02646 family)